MLKKIVFRHEWDRERSLIGGNYNAAVIFAIKQEAVEIALRELEHEFNQSTPENSDEN